MQQPALVQLFLQPPVEEVGNFVAWSYIHHIYRRHFVSYDPRGPVPLSPFELQLAMSGRAKCTLTPAVCELLLKSHVSSLDNQTYNHEDQEVVVKEYLGLLSACAQHTTRLNSTLVASSAQRVFGVHAVVAKKFGDAMSQALSMCYSKGHKATSGKKYPRV